MPSTIKPSPLELRSNSPSELAPEPASRDTLSESSPVNDVDRSI